MAVREILTGHDPQQIITLLDINGARYCDQVQAVTFGGQTWAPLDFTAQQQSDGYSALEIKVSVSRHLAAVAPCRLMRVGGSDVLYDAQGLDVISIDSGPGLCEISLGYLAATTPSMRTYSVDRYHGLRRYSDPELPAQQVYGEDAGKNAQWYPGKNIRDAIDRYQDFRERGGVQSIRRAALQPVRTANALIGRFVARFNAKRSVEEPGSPYMPSATLSNQPFPDRAIPERFGRSVFAPDIAHPAYCNGSGTTVTRRNVLCLGVGRYAVHRIWVGGTLAWKDGASTGNVAGLVVYQLEPGEQMALDYISVNSGPPLDANWQPLTNQARYEVDTADYSVTWMAASGSTETPDVPQEGLFFHRDNTSLTLPAGVVLANSGLRSSVLGKLPTSGISTNQVYVANVVPIYTRISFDQIRAVARRSSSLGPNLALFTGTVDGSSKIGDLAFNTISISGTNYVTGTLTLSRSGLQMIAAGTTLMSNAAKVYAADISIRPTYRPQVAHPDASHLRVDYTATAENMALPIIVEATRLIDGVPDDGIGAAAYSLAVSAFGSASVDQASFLAVPGSCGGADYLGSAPWELVRGLLETANARPVWRAGKLYAVINEPSAAAMLLTPRSMAQLTTTRSNKPKPIDAVSVEYTEGTTGAASSVLFAPPGMAGTAVSSLAMPFCRDQATADQIARASYLNSYRQAAVATVEMADDALALAPLDRVLLAAPDYGEALAWGLLLPGDDWTASAPADAVACVAYVRNADGSPFGPVAAMLGGNGRIYGAASTPAVTLPTHGAEWAAWERTPRRWAVADMRQGGNGSWSVDLVEELD